VLNAIEAFHRALDGRTFRHEKVGNGGNVTCPIILEHNLGLRLLSTTPYLNKNKHKFKDKCLMNLSKNEQIKHQNATMVSQRANRWCTYLYGVNKDTKNGSKAQKWWLGGCKIMSFREPLGS